MTSKIALKYFIFLSGLVLIISSLSCSLKDKYKQWEEEELLLIQGYLSENDTLDFELKSSGLYYTDIEIGTGLLAETHDTAYVFYTMLWVNGDSIETNVGTTDTLVFPVNENKLSVVGFDEGITYMREGGKAKFLVPSKLAFGDYIPYVFDVELVKLVKHSGRK